MLTVTRKPGEAVLIGNTIKITLVDKRGDEVILALEVPAEGSLSAEPKPPLSRSLKVLFDKVNIFVSIARLRRLRSVGPSALHTREYPGGPDALAARRGFNRTLGCRLYFGLPHDVSVQELAIILKATRAQCIVDALADLLIDN